MKKYLYSLVLVVAMMGTLSGCGKEDKKDKDEKTTQATTVEAGTTEKNNENDNNTDTDTSETSSSEASSEEATTDKTAQEIADAILAGGDYTEELMPLTEEVALNRLYDLDAEQIEESAFYTNSQATAEEIAVIKVKSADYVDAVKESFNTRIEDQKAACADYLPDEMPKLESAVVYNNGCYVVLCVSGDSAKVNTVIDGLFQ